MYIKMILTVCKIAVWAIMNLLDIYNEFCYIII